MKTTTESERIDVKVKKLHRYACNSTLICAMMFRHNKEMKESKMENQQPSLVEGKRKCRVCNKTKSLSEFRKYSSRGKGLVRNYCVACDRKWHHDYFANHPEVRAKHLIRARSWVKRHPKEVKANRKRYRMARDEENRNKVYAAYGNKCACCGITERMFLTVDHVNNDGCSERKKGLYTNGSQFYEWLVKHNFPKNYQLLCYNCNLGKARNKGVCPHQEGSEIIPKGSTAKRLEAPAVPVSIRDDNMTPSA
jgi:hypothetical protein